MERNMVCFKLSTAMRLEFLGLLLRIIGSSILSLKLYAFYICCPDCPEKSISTETHQCIAIHTDKLITWDSALLLCQLQGGSLAEFVDDRHFNEFLAGRINRLNEDDDQFYWVGGRQFSHGWEWLHYGPLTTVKHDNQTSEGSFCLKLHVTLNESRLLVVGKCHETHRYICDLGPFPYHWCQIEGLTFDLLNYLLLSFATTLMLERFLYRFFPDEHTLTFTWMNTKVILSGLFFVVLTEVIGPLYGWAQYFYSKDVGSCILDPISRHIHSYLWLVVFVVAVIPVTVIIVTGLSLMLSSSANNEWKTQQEMSALELSNGAALERLICVAVTVSTCGTVPWMIHFILAALRMQYLHGDSHYITFTLAVFSRTVAFSWILIIGLNRLHKLKL